MEVDKACRMLSIFDVFLLPSLYEGFPTVLLEAQANGLESVVSSTITPSIALTDLVHFVELDDSTSHWADQLIKYTCERHDTEKFNMLIAKYKYLYAIACVFAVISSIEIIINLQYLTLLMIVYYLSINCYGDAVEILEESDVKVDCKECSI